MITFESLSQSAIFFIVISLSLLLAYPLKSLGELKEIDKCYRSMEALSMAGVEANYTNESYAEIEAPLDVEHGLILCKGYALYVPLPLEGGKLVGNKVRCEKRNGEITCEVI